MTLNVTLANHRFVIQVSDRRLTVGGCPFDDDANKAAILVCRNAVMSITYTGLGYFGELPVDDWIVELLDQNNAARRDVGFAVSLLRQAAAQTFPELPPQDRKVGHTFLLAGWQLHKKRQVPYVWLISNCEDKRGRLIEPPAGHFRARYFRPEKGAEAESLSLALITGMEPAVAPGTAERLGELSRSTMEPDALRDEAVSVIRKAADHPDYGRYIRRNCLSVVLPQPGTSQITAEYLPAGLGPVAYTPQVITPGIVLRSSEVLGGGNWILHWGGRELEIRGAAKESTGSNTLFGLRSQRRRPRPK